MITRVVPALLGALVLAQAAPAAPSQEGARNDLRRASASTRELLAALRAVQSAPRLDDELIGLVESLSSYAEPPEVKVTAVDTIAAWLARHPGLARRLGRRLAETVADSSDPPMRVHAIQAITRHITQWPREVLEAVAAYLRDDRNDLCDRAIAALAFGAAAKGDPRARDFARVQLVAAYEAARDLNFRRQILGLLACYWGQQARATLERLPQDEELLAQDARDYVAILRSGERSPEAIFDKKFERDARRGTIVGMDRRPVE